MTVVVITKTSTTVLAMDMIAPCAMVKTVLNPSARDLTRTKDHSCVNVMRASGCSLMDGASTAVRSILIVAPVLLTMMVR